MLLERRAGAENLRSGNHMRAVALRKMHVTQLWLERWIAPAPGPLQRPMSSPLDACGYLRVGMDTC